MFARSLYLVAPVVASCLAGLGSGCGGVSPQIRVANGTTPGTEMAMPLTGGHGAAARIAPNRFETRCEGFASVAAKQRTGVWCWAACAEMVHAYKGNPMSQEEIAARIHGAGEPGASEAERAEAAQAASYDEIIRALVPEIPPQAQREAKVALDAVLSDRDLDIDTESYLGSHIQRRTVNSDILVDDLLHGEPLVVGLRFLPDRNGAGGPESASAADAPDAPDAPVMGHAYVVYGVDFARRAAVVPDEANNGATGFTGGLLQKIGLSRDEADEYQQWLGRVPYKYDLIAVHLLDPWVGEAVTMEAAEFARRVDFMISGREAREILEKERILVPED